MTSNPVDHPHPVAGLTVICDRTLGREGLATDLLIDQGIKGHCGSHQRLVQLHHASIAFQPPPWITTSAAEAAPREPSVSAEQIRITLLGQERQHKFMNPLTTISHGVRRWAETFRHHSQQQHGKHWKGAQGWM
jgi:hypothetical protein